jgi:hypothetical protein
VTAPCRSSVGQAVINCRPRHFALPSCATFTLFMGGPIFTDNLVLVLPRSERCPIDEVSTGGKQILTDSSCMDDERLQNVHVPHLPSPSARCAVRKGPEARPSHSRSVPALDQVLTISVTKGPDS